MQTVSPKLWKTECACTSLRRASRAICRLYDLVLDPSNLTATQFMILNAIADAGEVAQCDLATSMAASLETLSRRLANLRSAGLVEMRVGDRQRCLYRITPEGAQKLAQAAPYWQRAQLLLERALGRSDWLLLVGFTERVTSAAIRAETMPFSAAKPLRRTQNRPSENRVEAVL